MPPEFALAKNLINRARSILLATHEDPDGDAVGSMLALKMILEKTGKQATTFFPAGISENLNFLPGADKIIQKLPATQTDLTIGLDYGNYKRLTLDQRFLNEQAFLTIDHHLVGEHIGCRIIEKESSSTAEILYQFFNYLTIEIDQAIATCLLAGIFSDTGGFRFPNTSAQTLKITGELLLKGAPLQKIARLVDAANPDESRNLWIQAFGNMEIDIKNGVAFSVITHKNFSALNHDFSSSAIANLLSSAPEIKYAILCMEKEPGQLECSLRSQQDRGVDVAQIAKRFGGGGHRLAAGFKTDEKPEMIINKIKGLNL